MPRAKQTAKPPNKITTKTSTGLLLLPTFQTRNQHLWTIAVLIFRRHPLTKEVAVLGWLLWSVSFSGNQLTSVVHKWSCSCLRSSPKTSQQDNNKDVYSFAAASHFSNKEPALVNHCSSDLSQAPSNKGSGCSRLVAVIGFIFWQPIDKCSAQQVILFLSSFLAQNEPTR